MHHKQAALPEHEGKLLHSFLSMKKNCSAKEEYLT
jgi:hypothetical protein